MRRTSNPAPARARLAGLAAGILGACTPTGTPTAALDPDPIVAEPIDAAPAEPPPEVQWQASVEPWVWLDGSDDDTTCFAGCKPSTSFDARAVFDSPYRLSLSTEGSAVTLTRLDRDRRVSWETSVDTREHDGARMRTTGCGDEQAVTVAPHRTADAYRVWRFDGASGRALGHVDREFDGSPGLGPQIACDADGRLRVFWHRNTAEHQLVVDEFDGNGRPVASRALSAALLELHGEAPVLWRKEHRLTDGRNQYRIRGKRGRGRLTLVASREGAELWHYDLGILEKDDVQVFEHDGRVIVRPDDRLFALDLDRGALLWTGDLGGSDHEFDRRAPTRGLGLRGCGGCGRAHTVAVQGGFLVFVALDYVDYVNVLRPTDGTALLRWIRK